MRNRGMSVWAASSIVACVALGDGLDARAAEPEAAAIDAVFAQWNERTPGAALAVVRDEQIVYARGYGMANLDHSIPITPETVFDVGSVSKQFTAACIVLLEQDGKLSLDDDVREYLPELPEYGEPITIAHLLHHTSGLRDYTALMGIANLPIESNYSERFLLEMIFRQKGLNFEPGERFSYSNTGYFLLAEIVQRVSGMAMSRFARERIFGPLGMQSTIFWDDNTMIVRNRAESYHPTNQEQTEFVLGISLMDNVGDGGVYTTVEDLAKWDANFYHNVLGTGTQEFVERMEEVGKLDSGASSGYASGLFVGTHRGWRMVSHSGGWRGFRAQMTRFPEHRLTVICLGNVGSFQATQSAMRVADLYLPEGAGGDGPQATFEAATDAPTVAMDEAALERFGGTYRTDTGTVWSVTRRGEVLAVASSSGLRFTARPVGAMEFESVDRPIAARLTFSAGVDGTMVAIRQVMAGQTDLAFVRIEPMADAAAGLEEFAGMYESEEVGGWLRASVGEGQLMVTSSEDDDAFAIGRFERDGFALPGFELRFTRSGDGRVDGFVLNTPQARGIRYDRRE